MGITDLTPIGKSATPTTQKIGGFINKILTYDWIFSKWYEKIILILFIAWGFYSIIKFVWGLF